MTGLMMLTRMAMIMGMTMVVVTLVTFDLQVSF